MLVFGVGRVALIDPGRRFGKSTSRFLDVEDVSIAKKKKNYRNNRSLLAQYGQRSRGFCTQLTCIHLS